MPRVNPPYRRDLTTPSLSPRGLSSGLPQRTMRTNGESGVVRKAPSTQ